MLDLPPVKVKGLIKGLRYISQIFDGEKEHEMVIGNPTDVKHVAHIGADGPNLANPSWMNDYHSAPLSSSFGRDPKEIGSPKSASQEIPIGGGVLSPKTTKLGSPKPRRSRRNSGSTPLDSPADRSSHGSGSNHHRRHRPSSSSENVEDSSSVREGSSSRRSRRHRQKSDDSTVAQQESEFSDLPAIPKQSRRKERKSRLSEGSDSSVKSKNRSSVVVSDQV